MLFKTNGLQTLEVKEVKKLNNPIAQHHILFTKIICSFMLLILSKEQTLSRLGLSALLVITSGYDLDVSFQAIDSRVKFFMERCVWSLDTPPPQGVRMKTARRRTSILHNGQTSEPT